MKTSQFSSILLSALFYTSLLSTMFAMPLVLAAADRATVDRKAGVWDRIPEAPAKLQPNRDVRLPADAPVAGPVVKQAPIDKSGPDAAMIKPGKVRAKTIKA